MEIVVRGLRVAWRLWLTATLVVVAVERGGVGRRVSRFDAPLRRALARLIEPSRATTTALRLDLRRVESHAQTLAIALAVGGRRLALLARIGASLRLRRLLAWSELVALIGLDLVLLLLFEQLLLLLRGLVRLGRLVGRAQQHLRGGLLI